MQARAPLVTSLTALAVLAACQQAAPVTQGAFNPGYLGIETLLLDKDMVNFRVALKGARSNSDVEGYGRCAAAQYALIRGFGFARHVRTTVAKDGAIWRGDAVYVISAALPPGFKTIDAEVTVRDCGAQGIPTI